MKILKAGSLSIHDDSKWIPGEWREEPDAPVDGEACGFGLHSLKGDDPLKSPVFRFPCEVWQDECEGLCGEDKIKARYKRQRIVENVTARYPNIIAVNTFISETICSVQWFKEQTPEEWMVVNNYPSVSAASDAAAAGAGAGAAARAAARDAAGDAAWASARSAAAAAAWDAAGDAAAAAVRAAAGDADWDAAWDAAWSAAWDAARAAAGYSYSLIVADLNIDTTWLVRWWKCWELGYYPIREHQDKLVVGRIDKP